MDNLLTVKDLNTYFFTQGGTVKAVNGVDLDINKGEIVSIVGESGCGKTATAYSILRLISDPGKIVKGEINLEGENLLNKTNEEMRKLRGTKLSLIFQDPLSSLNPSYTIGWQVGEVFELNYPELSKERRNEETLNLLKRVLISDPDSRIKSYPHQFSGGMRQRILISIAIANNPALIIADEPTTALDVTVQAEIMDLLEKLRKDMNLSILFISHDLNLVAERCDKINVMYAGEIVESASSEIIFENPLHPYTQGLLESIPQIDTVKGSLKQIKGEVPDLIDMPEGCYFAPRCERKDKKCEEIKPKLIEIEQNHFCRCHYPEKKRKSKSSITMIDSTSKKRISDKKIIKIENLKAHFPLEKGIIDKIFSGGKVNYIKAVDGINLDIYKNETIGLVGESGCGKTTLGRAITFLTQPTGGKIYFNNQDLSTLNKRDLNNIYSEVQFIFQDPYSSLNPRMKIKQILDRSLLNNNIKSFNVRKEKIEYILNSVGLPIASQEKYPHEFSGGQRQRISIARALIVDPIFIVADEPTSSLDVSIQAQILELINTLKVNFNLTMMFISHNLRVVKYISDRIAIMYLGKIVELGNTLDIFQKAFHPYTKALFMAIPKGKKRIAEEKKYALKGVVPSPINTPSGCYLHPRCPFSDERCVKDEPVLEKYGNDHYVACHHFKDIN